MTFDLVRYAVGDGLASVTMTRIASAYAEWLSTSPLPKLFVNAEPGAILTGAQREFCRSCPNQTEVSAKGSHFIQEDSPDEVGSAVASWYRKIEESA